MNIHRGIMSKCGSLRGSMVQGYSIPKPVYTDFGWERTIKTSYGYDYVAVYTNTDQTWEMKIPESVNSIRYLVVGGGGAGGVYATCGGGGAGGFVEDTIDVSDQPELSISITVGKGGAKKTDSGGTFPVSNDGKPSILSCQAMQFEVKALGGGGGGTPKPIGTVANGRAGGSGGGASCRPKHAFAGGTSTQKSTLGYGIGNPGGNTLSNSVKYGGGGGGGAGHAGYEPKLTENYYGGNGGDGIMSMITGEKRWYAAGGGGGAGQENNSEYKFGVGGSGIGGDGGGYKSKTGANGGKGEDGTGSGGGGCSGTNGKPTSGAGGSGTVIIRYSVMDIKN